MRKLKIEVMHVYEIEINDSDDIVKEYASDEELVEDLISYNFSSILPVIATGGVKVIDSEIIEHSIA